MLNEEINKYNNLYSQLVSAFAELHNQNLIFVRTTGRTPGYICRKHLRDVELLSKQLKKQSQLVCKENLANIKLERKLKKEEKKNVKHSRTTKKSI
jgi:hypothetical protein